MRLKIKKVKCIESEKTGVKSRMYFFINRESLLEDMLNRGCRPYMEYRKLIPEVFKKIGMKAVKASWSQKAGCSCGCSPAFILEAYGKDIFVDIVRK